MDIFTTQLAQATRPVLAPKRSEKLKVKALAKEARLKKLKKGVHELDDSEYALYQAEIITDNESSDKQNQDEVVKLSDKARELEQITNSDEPVEIDNRKVLSQNTETKIKTKKTEKNTHLDIFI